MFPLTGLRLLLPAIVPSWRFFDMVTASPRLDYALLAASDGPAEQWQEFRPRPPVLTMGMMLRRLLWNASWNENLFLVSLSERLMSAATTETAEHSERELFLRVARHLDRSTVRDHPPFLQIRLRLVGRAGRGEPVISQIAYISTPRELAGLITR